MTDIIERLLDEQEDEHHERFEPPDVSCRRFPFKRSVSQVDVRRNTGGRAQSRLQEPPRLAPGTSDPLEETGETAALLAETAGQEAGEGQALNKLLYVPAADGLEFGTERPVQSGTWDKIKVPTEAPPKGFAETDGQDGEAASLPEKTRQTALYNKQWAVIPHGKNAWYSERRPVPGETAPASPLTAASRTESVSAAVLYQQLRQTAAAAQYRGQAAAAAAFLPTTPRTDPIPLHELDRAFQRDARRYDGGFELY